MLATLALTRTNELLAGRLPRPAVVADALTQGYSRAFVVSAIIILGAVAAAFMIPAQARAPAAGAAPEGRGETTSA